MEEVLAVESRPRPNKAALAVVLVVFFIVAFAGAFYAFGGTDLLSGLFALNGGTPAPQPSGKAPVAPAASPNQGSAKDKLPKGVDEAFTRRMYVEQLESQPNIKKLVANKVASMTFGTVLPGTDGTEVQTKVTFRDGTSAEGTLGLAEKQAKLFFVYISGRRLGQTGGDADTVASDSDDTLLAHNQPLLEKRTLDGAVLTTLVDEQLKSQEVLRGIADGTYTTIVIDGVDTNLGTATLNVTLSGTGKKVVKGRVLCIEKLIDDEETWFITSFSKV